MSTNESLNDKHRFYNGIGIQSSMTHNKLMKSVNTPTLTIILKLMIHKFMINYNTNIFQKKSHNEVVNKTKVYEPIVQYGAFFLLFNVAIPTKVCFYILLTLS